jgi:glyoxylase I family protein
MNQKIFTGMEHVALAARDPKALAEFYMKAAGFKTRITFDNGPDKPKTYMIGFNDDGPFIEIVPADPAKTLSARENSDPGLVHLAITVADYDTAAKHLAELGVRKEGEERKAPYGGRVQFYRDPEGNLFHILFRPTPLPKE